jgi:tetratricopeptide (TPR) repeat protein
MDIADCYRLLGLRSGASFSQIKESYRKLARQYHPDINPDDNRAKEKFIALSEAYRILLNVVQKEETVPQTRQAASVAKEQVEVNWQPAAKVKVTRKSKPVEKAPNLSEVEQQLKWNSYQKLQQYLKYKRFPAAIALVEGLAQRLPQDPEVRQWQAIVYQRWGRQLIADKQLDKARIYLKKALQTDPHNKSLWLEVEKDFRRLEQIFH